MVRPDLGADRPRAAVRPAGLRRAARGGQEADRPGLSAGRGVRLPRLLPETASAVRGEVGRTAGLEALFPSAGGGGAGILRGAPVWAAGVPRGGERDPPDLPR